MSGDVSLAFNLISRDISASSGIAKASNSVRAANLASAASSVALGAAEASAAAWAVALGSAISGSVGLAPAIFEGGAAAGIGLKIALGGLGAAWKALGHAQASSGPSASEVARQHASAVQQVTSAQEALARAQRDAISAQTAISDAEETAAKNLRDLTISVADARLDEQSATLAVADARTALTAAQESGNAEDIQKANIAYQQSIEDLESAKNKTSDLTEEQGKATAQGIQGSDAVVAARQQESDAVQAVKDATNQLASARANLNSGSGGGGAAESAAAIAMAKLSVNGRGLITTLKGLAPAWDTVQRSMQNHALAGVAGDVKDLSAKYLPMMHDRLNDMGDAFNSAIRSSLGVFKTKQGVSDVNEILTNTDKGLKILATAFAPIISGLLGMGAAGSGFLPMMSGWVAGLAKEFGEWVKQARASGQLASWLGTAETALHDVWIIGGNVAATIGDIFKAGGSGAGTNLLATIVKLTTNMRNFMGSARGQADISRVFGDLRNILGSVAGILPGLVSHTGQFHDTLSVTGTVMSVLAKHTGLLAKALPLLAAGYVLTKVASIGKSASELASIPTTLANAAATVYARNANKNLAFELRQQRLDRASLNVQTGVGTTATDAQAASTEAATVAAEEQAAAMGEAAAATEAQTAATEEAAVAQTELDVAETANPMGLIVLAILAVVAVFVLLWTKCSWFRDFWKGLWKDIEDAAKKVWTWLTVDLPAGLHLMWDTVKADVTSVVFWIHDKITSVVTFIHGLPGKIEKAASGMWDGIKDAFKDAIDWILRGWNKLHFQLPSINTHIPGVGVIGGFNVGLPQMPLLAQGGVIKHTPGGSAVVVGEGSEDEVVAPLSTLGGISGGDHTCHVDLTIDSSGAPIDELLLQILRRAIRAQGGGGATIGIKFV